MGAKAGGGLGCMGRFGRRERERGDLHDRYSMSLNKDGMAIKKRFRNGSLACHVQRSSLNFSMPLSLPYFWT